MLALAAHAPAASEQPELDVLAERRLGQMHVAAGKRLDDLRQRHAFGVLALDLVELAVLEVAGLGLRSGALGAALGQALTCSALLLAPFTAWASALARLLRSSRS